jgi:hypothetical protein
MQDCLAACPRRTISPTCVGVHVVIGGTNGIDRIDDTAAVITGLVMREGSPLD